MGDFGSATETMRIIHLFALLVLPKIWTGATFDFCNMGNSGIEPDKGKGIAIQEMKRPASCGLATMESGNEVLCRMDVSLKQTSICVVDQAGSVVREGVVHSDLRRSQFT